MKKDNIKSACKIESNKIENLKKILNDNQDDEELDLKSNVFKALSNPTRLKILYLLKKGDLCVCEIMAVLEIPQSTISHHINVLKTAGLLKSQRDGIWIQYRLKYPNITGMIEDELI